MAARCDQSGDWFQPQAATCLKNVLNGTWFGHPLHSVITDVPIAAWLFVAIFEIIWLISPASSTWAGLGAFVCPWHEARVHLCDGCVLTGPATVNAPRYEVRVHNHWVEVKRASSA